MISDLGFEAEASFVDCRKHPIVHAFENQRATDPAGTRTVGPAAGNRTIYRLGSGHDHRGATWYDPDERVVWLCAYALHRSGEPDDAFPYFHDLMQSDSLLPTEDDYASLFDDRGQRFTETVYEDAQELLSRARLTPGQEHLGILGGEEHTAVVVDVVDTVTETYVAFSVKRMDPSRVVLILGAFLPTAEFSDWELAATFPTRPLRLQDGEICYRILRD